MSLEDIETDFWAHHYSENPAQDEVEDDDFDLEKVLEEMKTDDWEDL